MLMIDFHKLSFFVIYEPLSYLPLSGKVYVHFVKMDDEKAIKQQIVKSAEAVKKKVHSLKNSRLDSEIALESMFKPVTERRK